jgi:vacuolar-type H+-ATPase subunit H
MLEVLNTIKETQKEAEKIINDASIEAEKIKGGLLQKSVTANEEAFLTEIAQAEKRADKAQKSSSLGIEQETKQILSTAEQTAKEIENKAKVNHEKAVNFVIDMIFSRSEKK